jgi:hypothetical protein
MSIDAKKMGLELNGRGRDIKSQREQGAGYLYQMEAVAGLSSCERYIRLPICLTTEEDA